MARIPLISYDEASPEVRQSYEAFESAGLAKFLSQAQALAHHPPLLKAVETLLLTYYQHSVVPRRYLELAILAVSAQNACEYCVVHHAPQAVDAGSDLDQVTAVTERRWRETDLFDDTERLVLEYAEQVTADANRVPQALFDQLQQAFSTEQLVELTMRIATTGFFNRFNDALHLDIEPIAQTLYDGALAAAPRTGSEAVVG